MKRVALFDADGTLFEGFSIFPLYDAFAEEGFIPRGESRRLQEVLGNYYGEEIDYRTFVIDTLQVAANVVAGRRTDAAARITELFFADRSFPWFGYVKPLMKEADTNKTLITAEPQFIARGIATTLGMDNHFSSQFGVEGDGTFAGNVVATLGSSQKGAIARRSVEGASISIGFGDSEGDIGMLEVVDNAFCIEPTDGLRRHALARNWAVVENPDQLVVLAE